jgi:hypothetical protein
MAPLVYQNYGLINNTFTQGMILSVDDGASNSKGFAGLVYDNIGIVNNSYSNVNIYSDGTSDYLNGLMYNNTGRVNSSFAIGKILGDTTNKDGVSNSSTDDTYWNMQTSRTSTNTGSGAVGLNTSQMIGTNAETYMTLDFDVFEIVKSSDTDVTYDGYPILSSFNRTIQLNEVNLDESPIGLPETRVHNVFDYLEDNVFMANSAQTVYMSYTMKRYNNKSWDLPNMYPYNYFFNSLEDYDDVNVTVQSYRDGIWNDATQVDYESSNYIRYISDVEYGVLPNRDYEFRLKVELNYSDTEYEFYITDNRNEFGLTDVIIEYDSDIIRTLFLESSLELDASVSPDYLYVDGLYQTINIDDDYKIYVNYRKSGTTNFTNKFIGSQSENGEYEFRINNLDYNTSYEYYLYAISVDETKTNIDYYDYSLSSFTTLDVPSDIGTKINVLSFFAIFKSGESWERQVVGFGTVIFLFIVTFVGTSSIMLASIVGLVVFILATFIGLIPLFYIIISLIVMLAITLFKTILGGNNVG